MLVLEQDDYVIVMKEWFTMEIILFPFSSLFSHFNAIYQGPVRLKRWEIVVRISSSSFLPLRWARERSNLGLTFGVNQLGDKR